MKVIKEHFNSIDEMLRAVNNREENKAMEGMNHSETHGKSFTGTASYKEACELFANGWDEPLEKIKKGTARNVKANVTRSKAMPATGIVGYAPCVPNAILGVPNSMIKTDRTPSKVKAVTLTYAITVSAQWTTEQLTQCGITVLNIVNDLELEGYRVGLNIEFMGTRASKETAIVTVKVKDWRQPMDIKKLAFPLVHPSMFRRFGFKWLETVPDLTDRGFRGGYGQAFSNDSYEYQRDFYTNHGVLGRNEYLITAAMCKQESHDKERIMKRAGIKLRMKATA